jgi:hypothetical protein
LQTTAPTIIRWKRRFLQHVLDGLDTFHPGQATSVLTCSAGPHLGRLSKEADQWLHALELPQAGAALDVSKDAVHRVWKEAGLKPNRLERYMASNDREFEQGSRHHRTLSSRRNMLLCSASMKKQPFRRWIDSIQRLPFSPGRAERHGFEYYRHGTLPSMPRWM